MNEFRAIVRKDRPIATVLEGEGLTIEERGKAWALLMDRIRHHPPGKRRLGLTAQRLLRYIYESAIDSRKIEYAKKVYSKHHI